MSSNIPKFKCYCSCHFNLLNVVDNSISLVNTSRRSSSSRTSSDSSSLSIDNSFSIKSEYCCSRCDIECFIMNETANTITSTSTSPSSSMRSSSSSSSLLLTPNLQNERYFRVNIKKFFLFFFF